MTHTAFQNKLKQLRRRYEQLIRRRNRPQENGNGIFDRYEFPVLTADHTPLFWRYDFDPVMNPHLMTRLGINCVFNVGAMEWNGNIVLMTRTEGWDRKSFFAVAESRTGVDGFHFIILANEAQTEDLEREGFPIRQSIPAPPEFRPRN